MNKASVRLQKDKTASLYQGGVINIGEYTCEVELEMTLSLSMVRVFQGGEAVALQKVNFHDIVGESDLFLKKLVVIIVIVRKREYKKTGLLLRANGIAPSDG